jgi:uncharacterized protein
MNGLCRFSRSLSGSGEMGSILSGVPLPRTIWILSSDILHLYDLGFDQISIEPVVADRNAPYALTEEHLPVIFEEYERLARLMAQRTGRVRADSTSSLCDGSGAGPMRHQTAARLRMRKRVCGGNTRRGRLSLPPICGPRRLAHGNVFDRSLDMRLKERFRPGHVYGKEDCRQCWAKFYCSGGCNANGMLYRGDILKPHVLSCQMEKETHRVRFNAESGCFV